MKFGVQTNSNMMNLMAMFNFSILDWKYIFWTNLVQKTKIVKMPLGA